MGRQLTELEELEIIYCDLHKDVYGVKARWAKFATVELAREAVRMLGVELEAVMAREKIYQQGAITAFEELAKRCGGVETAKRWQHQAYGTDGDDEYLAYRLGLPYGYFKKVE